MLGKRGSANKVRWSLFSYEKRGQVTLFIIIGLLLLISAGVYIAYTKVVVEKPFVERARPTIAEVPVEFAPVRDYVTTCLKSAAKDGLKRIGSFGGYINPPAANPVEPTESKAVLFAPQSSMSVPYWWYLSSPNDCEGNCEYQLEIPALQRTPNKVSVEGQLDDYVSKKVKECVGEYSALGAQGFSVKEGSRKVESNVAKDSVFFVLEWPLNVERNGKGYKIDKFFVEFPLNLREIYQLAVNLTMLEAEHHYLENHVINLLSIYGKTDKDAIPPTEDTELGLGSGTYWLKSDVLAKVKAMLASNIPLLQVYGTRGYRFIPAPAGSGDTALAEDVYNRNMIIPLNEDHTSLDVKYTYLDWWKPYFDLNCRGELCQPESMLHSFGFLLGIQRYRFAYDISWPTLVSLSNPDAFEREGFSFKFMLEGNVRNNFPLTANFTPAKMLDIGGTTLLCQPNQLNSANVSIKVIDGKTQQPTTATLIYNCGSESCTIGDFNGAYTGLLPVCIGGTLAVVRDGYFSAYTPLDTSIDASPPPVTLAFQPFRQMEFDVQFIEVKKGTKRGPWQVDTQNLALQSNDESTSITLERIGNDFEEPFTAVGVVEKSPAFRTGTFRDIRLLPGKYRVSITTMQSPQPPLVIPKDERKYGGGGIFGHEKKVFIPPEPIIFNDEKKLLSAGAQFEFELTPEKLDSGKKILFKAVRFALDKVPENDRIVEDLGQMGKTSGEYSRVYRAALEPEVTS